MDSHFLPISLDLLLELAVAVVVLAVPFGAVYLWDRDVRPKRRESGMLPFVLVVSLVVAVLMVVAGALNIFYEFIPMDDWGPEFIGNTWGSVNVRPFAQFVAGVWALEAAVAVGAALIGMVLVPIGYGIGILLGRRPTTPDEGPEA